MKNRIQIYNQLERYAQYFAVATSERQKRDIDLMAREYLEHHSSRNIREYLIYYQRKKAEETIK